MPSTQLPASFAGVLSMSAGQQMNLGVPTTSFDGRTAFTLSGWFQVPSTEDNVVVLAQGNLLSFSFFQRRPTVTLGSAAPLRMEQALPAGQFHQLAAVYTPQQNGTSGTLSFFVDGAYVGDASVSASAPVTGLAPSLIVGNARYPVAVRRVWMAPIAVPTTPDNLVVETRFGTLGSVSYSTQSSWDWGQVPAAIVGAPAPIAIGGAAPSITTPGLWAGAQGAATTSVPEGTTFDQVTVQGWFWFPPSVTPAQVGKDQVLVQVGTPFNRLALVVNPTASGAWSVDATLGQQGFGRTDMALSGWHNIAFTWAGGLTGTLYVDGNLINQGGGGDPSSVDLSTVYIGNTPPGGNPANQAFAGSIQNVVLWNVALAAEDIQAQMLPWFPMTDVDPVAVYDFTQSPPFDIANGEALTLRSGAVVQNMLWSASNAEASTQMLTLEARPKRTQSLKGLRPQSPPKVDPSVWTPEKEQRLLSEMRGYLAKGGNDPRLQAEGPALEAKLKERFARGRAGNPDLTGIVHTEQQGDEWITFYYGENGPRAILRRSTTNFKADSCMNWMIDFVATALFGLLDIMGIPLSTHAATKALQKLLGKSKIWAKVTTVVAQAITDELTGDTIVGLLKAIYDGGGISTFVKAVLDDVSWWDFLWMVAQVTIELIGLLVPGLEEALVLAKCVLLVAQLIQLMTDRPAHCPV